MTPVSEKEFNKTLKTGRFEHGRFIACIRKSTIKGYWTCEYRADWHKKSLFGGLRRVKMVTDDLCAHKEALKLAYKGYLRFTAIENTLEFYESEH